MDNIHLHESGNCQPIGQLSTTRESVDSITALFEIFDPITLLEMDDVELMNRVDTKFIIGISMLPQLLKKAAEDYRILEIGGSRMNNYSTVYFDTSTYDMYMMHHNGKLNRLKIRMRSYVNSDLYFLEIKRKTNKGKTSKRRIAISSSCFNAMGFGTLELQFVTTRTPFHPTSLIAQMQDSFQRITLVDKNMTERVTIDTSMVFKSIPSGVYQDVEGLVIIEMKQAGFYPSNFGAYLHELHVLPGSLSKYCLGMVLVNPNLKSNQFKRKLRKIYKLTTTSHETY
jgi:VTC domain